MDAPVVIWLHLITPVAARRCACPCLTGPQRQLARVLRALNDAAIDPETGRGIVDLQWVHALRIEGGEAELTLGFAPVCESARAMTESAFQTLRRLLPDTDVYVLHQR